MYEHEFNPHNKPMWWTRLLSPFLQIRERRHVRLAHLPRITELVTCWLGSQIYALYHSLIFRSGVVILLPLSLGCLGTKLGHLQKEEE